MNGKAIVIPMLGFGAWELAGRTILPPTDSTTRPSDILAALWSAAADGSLASVTAETLASAAAGFLLATALGIGLAIPLGLSTRLRNIVTPSVELLRPVPPVALIPLGILMFGFGPSMEIMIVAFACIWPVLALAVAAVRGIEPRLIEVARNFELSLHERITKIVLPSIVPRLFVGLRLAAGVALIVAVTVEIAANPRGAGYELILAQQNLRPDRAYGLLIWIGFVGWTLNAALTGIERSVFGHLDPTRWRTR